MTIYNRRRQIYQPPRYERPIKVRDILWFAGWSAVVALYLAGIVAIVSIIHIAWGA